MKKISPLLMLCLGAALASAQGTNDSKPPVIDVHVHAMGVFPGVGPMCPFPPGFQASDPKSQEAPFGWVPQECTPKLEAAKTTDEYRKAVIAEMERMNATAILMGDPAEVKTWMDLAPGRFIPGTGIDDPKHPGQFLPVEELRKDFTEGGFKIMGEIGLQYQGMSPSDPAVDKYFALAEELDIPVGIHMGTGGSGRANITTPKFRGSMGNPLLLEELLARHPKLRLWIMHAGYPMIDNLLTLLQANSHVYVDVAGLIWSYPAKQVNDYIRRIVEAGFEDRVMFGTDQMIWPKLMATSISVIQNADYLTPQQKRDILYNNAARFLRIDSRIAGTLLNKTTGEPVQRATVSVLAIDDDHIVTSMITDAQGQFSFDRLPAAKYPLTASKRGFRTAFFDDHDGYNTAIVTGPDQDTTHLIFFLIPNSVLHGVVTGDGGDPVEGARVMLFRKAQGEWTDFRTLNVGTTTTDDIGAYEFANLADGEYSIAVSAQPWFAIRRAAANAASRNAKELDVAYPVTYYDSTTDEDGATPVSIGQGSHVQADIHLHAVPALRITVDGVRRAGGRIARPELQQIIFGTPVFAESVGLLDALQKGSTDFYGMAPGHYELTVGDPPRVVDLDASENTVVGPDAGTPLFRVTGTLRMANGSAPPDDAILSLRPFGNILHHTLLVAPTRNGHFELNAAAPGTWGVTVNSRGGLLSVLGVGTEGAVHAGNTITVRDNTPDLVVLLGKASAHIQGFVEKDGKGIGGTMVVLVPKDPTEMEALSRRDQSDSDGSFSLGEVVPGQYTVVAIEDGWKLDWTAPGALARYLPRGTAVTVQDNSATTVHLAGPVVVQPR